MKKTLCVLLALLLALSFGSALADSKDIVNPAGVFPIVKEPITLKVLIVQDGNTESFTDNYYTKWLEEKTGIHLEFEEVARVNAAEKVQLLLTGNNYPDIMFGIGRANATVFSTTNIIKYGVEGDGQLLPLNGYIEEYGVNIKDLFAEYSEGISLEQMMTSADGNIYYMLGFGPQVINRSTAKIWLNRGWMEKLELETPTTTEQFKEVLRAFRDRDPNGNGMADEIPLVGVTELGSTGGTAYDTLLASFCTNNTQYHRLTFTEDGVVEFAPVSDAWRNGLAYCRELVDEGLYTKLTFTQDTNSFKQITCDENDICGCFMSLGIVQGGPSSDELRARYICIDPLEGPEGVRLSVLGIPTPAANGVITDKCAYPEAAFRLMDLMVGPEASAISRFGQEGVNWQTPAEGTLDNVGTQALLQVLQNSWARPGKVMWQNYCPFVVSDLADHQAWSGNPYEGEYMNAQGAVRYLQYEPKNQIPLLIFDLDEADVVNEIFIYVDEYVRTSAAKFITGEWDVNNDADWAKYLKEYEALDLDTMLKYCQTTYDRMTGK